MARFKLINIKSATANKTPGVSGTGDNVLQYGEIAVNYNSTNPFLSIRNSADNLVQFFPIPKVTDDATKGSSAPISSNALYSFSDWTQTQLEKLSNQIAAIPTGSSYTLTSAKMSSAWGSDSVSGGSLTLSDRCNATNGFFQTSDARYKTFTGDIEVDFEQLKAVPKKYFYWKDDDSQKQQIGTSAQAIMRVYPELVSKDAETGKYSVDYAKLSVIALAAIDQLNEKIEMLEDKIASMKK